MLIALVRWAVITAARVLSAASAALVSLANALGLSAEVRRKPVGRRRRHERQLASEALRTDCQYESRRSDFLLAAGDDYGYGGKVEDLTTHEFSRLRGRVYVDHAGATLYSEKQIRATCQELSTQLYSNPHSGHVAWSGDASASDAEAHARAFTLAMCNASPQEYECIFVSGATGGMKLVAEAFPWSPGSRFVYTQDSHNSAVGMRELALAAGASFQAVNFSSDTCEGPLLLDACSASSKRSSPEAVHPSSNGLTQLHSLFAYPLESNFSGVRYNAAHVRRVQEHGLRVRHASSSQSSPADPVSADEGCRDGCEERWSVLLDAAKACCSAPPDLSKYPADFVVLSYYKIFGYPTGLGALLVRKDTLSVLTKRYFGGGAVTVSVADGDFFRRRSGAAGLEDGTPAYLAIASLAHGYAQLARVGSFPAIERHTATLTRWLARKLASMRHSNGQPVCVLYGAHPPHPESEQTQPHVGGGMQSLPGAAGQGPVIAFNLLRPDGSFVGYREVEKMAGLCSIMLRTGCFCNPGACQAHLGLSHQDVVSNFEAGHVCWDDNDLIHGRPTGAVRVSFGYMSTFADADAVHRFISDYFADAPPSTCKPLDTFAAAQEPQTGSFGLAACLDDDETPEAAPHAGRAEPATAPLQETETPGLASADLPAFADSSHHASAAKTELTAEKLPEALASSTYASGQDSSAGMDAVQQEQQRVTLERIWVYPIKSCAGFAPNSWPLGANGLLYDREWALVDAEGAVLTQKKLPRLAAIRPIIRMDTGILEVHAPGMGRPCVIPLVADSATAAPFSQPTSALAGAPGSGSAEAVAGGVPRVASDTCDDQEELGPMLHRASSGSSLSSMDGSFTGSLVSQSGVSFSGSLGGSVTSRRSNSAIWPRRSMQFDRSSASGQPHAQRQPSIPSSTFAAAAADPVGAAALAREAAEKDKLRAKKMPDLRAVRSRFRHLRSRPCSASSAGEPRGPVSEPGSSVSQPKPSSSTAHQQAGLPAAGGGSSDAGASKPERPGTATEAAVRQVQICADSVCSFQVGESPAQYDAVSDWFSEAVGVRCWLVRQRDGSRRAVDGKQLRQRGPPPTAEADGDSAQCLNESERNVSIGFANEGQFLAISQSSLDDVNRRLAEKAGANTSPFQVDAERFRANLLFSRGLEPYAEDAWRQLHIGESHFSVTGPCARCQVICTDQEAGQRGGPEPLLTLAAYRRTHGQIHFGILLEHNAQATGAAEQLCIGQTVPAS